MPNATLYRDMEVAISRGFSPWTRWPLGLMCLATSVTIIAMDGKRWEMLLVGSVFGSLSGALLLRGRAQRLCGRVVGAALFVSGAWYLSEMVREGRWLRSEGEAQSVVGAALFMTFGGLPGGYYAWKGRFRPSVEAARSGDGSEGRR